MNVFGGTENKKPRKKRGRAKQYRRGGRARGLIVCHARDISSSVGFSKFSRTKAESGPEVHRATDAKPADRVVRRDIACMKRTLRRTWYIHTEGKRQCRHRTRRTASCGCRAYQIARTLDKHLTVASRTLTAKPRAPPTGRFTPTQNARSPQNPPTLASSQMSCLECTRYTPHKHHNSSLLLCCVHVDATQKSSTLSGSTPCPS